jgi:predicted peptidase
MKQLKKKCTTIFYRCLFIVLMVICLSTTCKKNEMEIDYNILSNLPKDKGGYQTAVYYDSLKNEYGYYVYTPSDYMSNKVVYPLLVFLHGSGERGNSSRDTSVLKKVLLHGPPMLIDKKQWNPRYPMIVVSPQCHEGSWNAEKLHRLFQHLSLKYRVNKNRIYLTGLSMGGFGTFTYLQNYSDTGFVAAAVPICGGGNTLYAKQLMRVPIWAFHGDADPVVNVSRSKDMVMAINALNPSLKAKLTIFPGIGHNSWACTYDGTGMGTESIAYDAFDMNIYDWMFRYSK